MKVKITCGGYCLTVKENRSKLVFRGEVVDVTDKEATLLINRGQAVAVSADSEAREKPESIGEVSTSASTGNNEDDQESADSIAYSMDNTAAELKAIMEAEGLTIRSGMTKREMVDALDAYFASEDDEDDELPDLSPEVPVV